MIESKSVRTSVVVIGIGVVIALFVALRIDPHFFVIPDELVTATIAKRVSVYQPIVIVDPLIPLSGGLIHPRSMTTVGDRMVPEGFLALGYWYGLLMRIIPVAHLPFIISILSTLGASIALRFLLPIFFEDKKILRFAPFIYPVLPPILYYTFHPYLANLLQWNIVLIVAAVVIRGHNNTRLKFLWWFGIGVLYGVALSLRPVESLWIVPLTLLLLFFNRNNWSWLQCGSACVGVFLPLALLAMLQHDVYGAWWVTGYALNPALGPDVRSTHPIVSAMVNLLFPFGIHLETIWYRIQTIALPLGWWAVIIAAFGFRRRIFGKSTYGWWGSTMAIGVWLLIYYGSWAISEPEDTGVVAYSTGFVRYALPLWALTLPLLVSGIIELSNLLPRFLRNVGLGVVIGCFILTAMIYAPGSLLDQQREIAMYPDRVALVIKATPLNAVILTKRSDKVYFPYRRVIVWYKEPQKVLQILPALIQSVPLFIVVEDNEGQQFTLPQTVRVVSRVRISQSEELLKLGMADASVVTRRASMDSYEQ